MTTKTLTPLQLVKLIVLGTLLINASWLLDFLPFHQPAPNSGFWLSLWMMSPAILVVGVFVAGALLIWCAGKRLSDGIRLEAWAEEQLTSARNWSDSKALNSYSGLLLLFSIATLVLGHILHFRWNVLVLIYLTYPLNWMKTKLRKPLPPRLADDWRQRPRIVSSHWGEPADHTGSSSA